MRFVVPPRPCPVRGLTAWLLAGVLAGPAAAAAPAVPAPAAAPPAGVSPRLERVVVSPQAVELAGPRAYRQLIVSGHFADGSDRDLTRDVELAPENSNIATIGKDGFLTARGDGQTTITVKAGSLTEKVSVRVTGFAAAAPVSFRREVIGALNVAGCNAGACHGTPSGKNGFKLSLRGFDPAADYLQLTRDVTGRRVDPQHPEDSLVLLKGEARVPHEGGKRLLPDAVATRAVRDWLSGGLPNDPAALGELVRLEVLPGDRVLRAPAWKQQLVALAHFADGSVRDVTRLTVFASSDEGVARVSPTGLVEFERRGEVAVLCRYLLTMAPVKLTAVNATPADLPPQPEANYIDKLLFAKQRLLGIPASPVASDAEYVRRVTLDVCGVLPTPDEVRSFLDDSDPNKRAALVERLLNRPEYSEYWAMKWADVLAQNRRAVQAKGVYLYRQWLQHHLRDNTPWDKVVRELLTAGGSTFMNPPANYFRNDRKARPADDLAQNTAQLFLGVRMSCAKCHNHPFERWTQDDYYGLAAFFARVKDRPDALYPRVNRFNLGALDIYTSRSGEAVHLRTNAPAQPRFPGGETPEIRPDQDRREVLADWLTRADNPFFARAAVNRIWFHLLGRGIVDAVDDFRDSNPPASAELLDTLAKDFVAHGFDNRYVIRTITASRVYQLSAATVPGNRDDERYFSHAVTRLLPAEVLLDALSAATEVPEVFQGTKAGTRAVQLTDGDVYQHPFLKAFGQPARETACACERGADTGLGQALQLVNGPTVKAKLAAPGNRIARLLAQKLPEESLLQELYLATLSRQPTPVEAETHLHFVRAAGDKRQAWEDVQWALINSSEFLFRH